jgi:hypothetical protein
MTESGHCLSHCLLNGQWKDNATTPSTVLDISDMRRSDLSSSMSVDFFFFFFLTRRFQFQRIATKLNAIISGPS